MVSILTVTNRMGGIDILKNNLRRQTLSDFEVVLVDEHYDKRKDEVAKYLQGFHVKHIKPRPPAKGDAWNLNKAYNDGFDACEGDIIVSLQDYIWMPPQGLERFLRFPSLVSGVGHKAKYPDTAYDLEGKITIFEKEFNGKPEGIAEYDERIDGPQIEEVNFSFFELNYAAIPRKIIKEIGGMDEEADKYYSGDNVQLGFRCAKNGHSIFLDRGNECIGFYHQQWFPRPEKWEEKHFNKKGDVLQKYVV